MKDKFVNFVLCLLICAVALKTFTCFWISPNKEPVEQECLVLLGDRAEDLAFYYEQHKKATPHKKKAIEFAVFTIFSEFDKEQLVNGALKQFLVNCRFKYKDVK